MTKGGKLRKRIWSMGGNPDTESICSTCRKCLTRDKFNKNKGTANGVSNNCRLCFNKFRKDWLERVFVTMEKVKPE